MNELVTPRARIAAMTPAAIERARLAEAAVMQRPQVELPVEHFLHAGLYQRTVRIPAGVAMVGALIRIPTLLVFSGRAWVYVGTDEPLLLEGHQVIQAEAGRKQVFVALADSSLTMVFATGARSLEEAEDEFTDEASKLQSRKG